MRHLERILDNSSELLRLSSQAGLIARACRVYKQFVPAALAGVSAVTNVRCGKMLLRADSGAVAARLRQLAPSLIDRLQKEGIDIRDVIVQTQPGLEATETVRPAGPPKAVSARSLEHMEQLAQTLPEDDPLRRSLNQLIARAKLTKGR